MLQSFYGLDGGFGAFGHISAVDPTCLLSHYFDLILKLMFITPLLIIKLA